MNFFLPRRIILSANPQSDQCSICKNPVSGKDRYCEHCGAMLREFPNAESFEFSNSQQGTPRRQRRLRSKPQRWYSRWSVRLLVLILVLVGSAAGYLWMRIDSTMTRINSQSALPAQIQDHTVADFQGTPLALLPTVRPRPTQSGAPPTVVVPQYEGASPGGPARQTVVSLVFYASPESATPSHVAVRAGTPSPVASPTIDGDMQAEMMLAAGMTFDTGPAQTAVAVATAQRSLESESP